MSAFPRTLIVGFVFLLSLPLIAQTDTPGAVGTASGQPESPPSGQTLSSPSIQTGEAPPQKADALLLYRQGRDLDDAGKTSEASALYNKAVSICDSELAADPRHMDAYAVKCWCLFRLGRHQDVIDVGTAALKVVFDARIVEVMGESYYFLGKNDLSIQSFTKYLESGQFSDRIPTAYFYLGEIYLRIGKWSHADIAYSTAVKGEPSMSRWWYSLGEVCEHLGDWQRAADSYNKALSLEPGMQEATDGLARVKAKLST